MLRAELPQQHMGKPWKFCKDRRFLYLVNEEIKDPQILPQEQHIT